METKICGKCKNEFPKTEEYFFKRLIKQENKKGLSIYFSFKSSCKTCHKQQSENNRIKNRCKHLNCEVSEYRENWKMQYRKTRQIYVIGNSETKSKFHAKNITDIYLKTLLRNSFLPKEIIETKRLIIQLKRELKTLKTN